jgi:hypothetical protein
MNKLTDIPPASATNDLVLREVWRAKDTLSAEYGHNLDKLFAETGKRELKSGHPLVKLPAKPRKG